MDQNSKKQGEVKPDGNDFHYKAVHALRNAGWTVRVSPHYNDAFSEKPREIDIIAEKAFPSMQGSVYRGAVIVRLFVECKYIAEQTTFHFDNRNIDKAKEVVERTRAFHEPDQNLYVMQKHHYLSDSLIATLYRTEGKNIDGDPIHKGINQCLNATIYYRHHRTELWKKYNHQSVVELNYSVIVCNAFEKFTVKDTTANSAVSSVTQPFQLEVDYAYTSNTKPVEEVFYVDVLNINQLKDFEEQVLLEEVNLARQKISDDVCVAAFERMRSGEDDYDPFGAL